RVVNPRTKSIWVVDDEPDVLTYMMAFLEDEEFEVRGFESGDGFLDEARKSPPDLICLDIMMPSKSGLSVYKDLRSEERLGGIPVIIVSGYSRQEEFLDGEFQRLVGGGDVPEPDGYMEKPVRMNELLDLVRKLLSAGEA
ncbi:MAG: response regulator, partial [Deltaproteobacteria bacterium]|nr:response regulator [Deltaproteobacteria bacterium]